MGRELSKEKREKYLNASLKLFVEKGIQNVSTAEIAKEAGTAAGTLFLYFPTKQSLINELALFISREHGDFIKPMLNPSFSAHDTFLTIWNGSIHWLLEHMDAYQYQQQVRDSGIIPENVVLETAKNLSYYYDAVQKGYEEGSIKPFSTEMIGGFLYQDIVAVMNLIRMQPDRFKQMDFIKQGFDIFWDGIKSESIKPEKEMENR